jgi:hypothetical protein
MGKMRNGSTAQRTIMSRRSIYRLVLVVIFIQLTNVLGSLEKRHKSGKVHMVPHHDVLDRGWVRVWFVSPPYAKRPTSTIVTVTSAISLQAKKSPQAHRNTIWCFLAIRAFRNLQSCQSLLCILELQLIRVGSAVESGTFIKYSVNTTWWTPRLWIFQWVMRILPPMRMYSTGSSVRRICALGVHRDCLWARFGASS